MIRVSGLELGWEWTTERESLRGCPKSTATGMCLPGVQVYAQNSEWQMKWVLRLIEIYVEEGTPQLHQDLTGESEISTPACFHVSGSMWMKVASP